MINIVPITHTQLDDVYRVQCESYPSNLHEPVELFQNLLECKGSICYAAFYEGQVEGYIFSYPSMSNRSDFQSGAKEITGDETAVYIHDLCISPKLRGKNAAKALYEKVAADAKKRGYDELIAVSIEDAIPFWQKYGFVASDEYDYQGSRAFNIRKGI